jgi:hypothetical protein
MKMLLSLTAAAMLAGTLGLASAQTLPSQAACASSCGSTLTSCDSAAAAALSACVSACRGAGRNTCVSACVGGDGAAMQACEADFNTCLTGCSN